MLFNVNNLETVTPINEEVKLNDLLNKESDILKVNHCLVTGVVKKEGKNVVFDININANLDLACSLTLKPVPYDLIFDAEIIFSDDIELQDFVLENPIDLRPYILAYIITEKPITIYHPDADQAEFEKKEEAHSAFASLKDLKIKNRR